MDVEVGQTVTCEVVQKEQWWNGKQLSNVTTGVMAKASAPGSAPAKPVPAASASQGGKPAPEGGADRQTRYSMRIPAGNLTYSIDVRVAKNNKPYLTITQTDAQGKQRVIVFENGVKAFGDALKQALDLFKL